MDDRYIRDRYKRSRNTSSYRSSRVQNDSKVIDIKTIRRKKSNIPGKNQSRPQKGLINIAANIFNSRDALFFKRIGILTAAVAAIILLIWIIYAAATNKNAYEVFIQNKSVGFIEKDKNTTEALLSDTVKAMLVEEVGADVQIFEKLTIALAHASKKDIKTVENIMTTIRKSLSYKVEASMLLVNGEQVAILKNADEADEALQRLISQYVPKEKNITKSGFVEEVTKKSIYVNPDEIITVDKAYTLLSQTTTSEIIHTATPGDTLWGIANNAGLTLDELLTLNPHLSIDSVVKIGMEVKLMLPKPFLSVITKEEVTRLETIKKPVVYQDNPEKKKNYQKSVQQGKDGQKEVVEYVVRVNGFETGIEPLSEETIIEPITEIIERGTQ